MGNILTTEYVSSDLITWLLKEGLIYDFIKNNTIYIDLISDKPNITDKQIYKNIKISDKAEITRQTICDSPIKTKQIGIFISETNNVWVKKTVILVPYKPIEITTNGIKTLKYNNLWRLYEATVIKCAAGNGRVINLIVENVKIILRNTCKIKPELIMRFINSFGRK